MSDSLQSVLAALGTAVISSIWQTGLIWLLVVAYTRFHEKLLPQRLSNISFWALLAGFTAFVFSFVLALIHPGTGLGMLQRITTNGIIYPVMVYSAIAYMLLLVIPFIQFIRGTQSVYHLRKKGLGRVPGSVKIFLLDAVQYLDIKRKVQVFTSTLISSPVTIGFLKPIILLPIALVNRLSTTQVQAILLHELAHIKRNDYLQNLITQIILTLLYFNPFARLLANMQNLEREKSADNWVLQFEYNNQMYAQTLLLLAKQNMPYANPLAVPIATPKTSMLERIEYLLGSGKRRYPSFKNIMALSSLIIVMAFVALFSKKPVVQFTALASTAPVELQAPVQFTSNNKKQESETPKNNPPKATVVVYQANLIVTKTEIPSKEKIAEPKQDVAEPIDNPIDETVSPVFVSHIENTNPVLETEEEKNVQEALKATQKIVVELSWNMIENSLAETVTQQEKQLLKEAYIHKMEAANWEQQANMLRLRYQNIDWDETYRKLALAIASIKMDSIYKEYKNTTHQLHSYKKQLEKDSTYQKKEIAAVNDLIQQYKTVIQKIDSVRSTKVVEL